MLKIILGFFLVGSTTWAEDVKPKFHEPVIISVVGKASITEGSGKNLKAKAKQLLREKVTIQTEAKAWVLVGLSKAEKLLVGPSSKVSLPVISWEDGAVERIELISGAMRLVNMTSTGRMVVTPVSRDAYSEGDLIFQFDADKKSLKLSVLSGRALFRGQEVEEVLGLEEGDEATFTPVIENGEIVYDVLLQGRRVARGKMSPKSRVSADVKQNWIGVLEKAQAREKVIDILNLRARAKSGMICKKPGGMLNECAWICEGNPKKEKKICRLENPGVKCVRYRCDADGKWSDPLAIIPSQAPCQAQPVLKPCDY